MEALFISKILMNKYETKNGKIIVDIRDSVFFLLNFRYCGKKW